MYINAQLFSVQTQFKPITTKLKLYLKNPLKFTSEHANISQISSEFCGV